eukprot:1156203-Pelagomonas_calceolata.AAC.1
MPAGLAFYQELLATAKSKGTSMKDKVHGAEPNERLVCSALMFRVKETHGSLSQNVSSPFIGAGSSFQNLHEHILLHCGQILMHAAHTFCKNKHLPASTAVHNIVQNC